jgi:hypothetical protein
MKIEELTQRSRTCLPVGREAQRTTEKNKKKKKNNSIVIR